MKYTEAEFRERLNLVTNFRELKTIGDEIVSAWETNESYFSEMGLLDLHNAYVKHPCNTRGQKHEGIFEALKESQRAANMFG